MCRMALSVESVVVVGAAGDDGSVGPTMVFTHPDRAISRPYIDLLVEINPIDSTLSARIVLLVQSMRVVFDAVSNLFSPSYSSLTQAVCLQSLEMTHCCVTLGMGQVWGGGGRACRGVGENRKRCYRLKKERMYKVSPQCSHCT